MQTFHSSFRILRADVAISYKAESDSSVHLQQTREIWELIGNLYLVFLSAKMPSDSMDLSIVLKAQQDRDLAPNVSSQVSAEMKSSLIFQYNWAELLQSAPTSLSSLGACFVASSSPKAQVNLKSPPGKGFQYLKYSDPP